MGNPSKALLYARVSTKNQLDSLNRQLEELKKYAEDNDYVYKVYHEVSCGVELELEGSDHNRLMDDVVKEKPDAIIVTSLDRFGRDTTHILNSTRVLEENNVKFISLKENIDTSTRAGRFLLHILSAVAEMERELIRERLHAGYEQAMKDKRVGRKRKHINLKQLMEYYNKNVSYTSMARIFGVAPGTILNRIKELKESGEIEE